MEPARDSELLGLCCDPRFSAEREVPPSSSEDRADPHIERGGGLGQGDTQGRKAVLRLWSSDRSTDHGLSIYSVRIYFTNCEVLYKCELCTRQSKGRCLFCCVKTESPYD